MNTWKTHPQKDDMQACVLPQQNVARMAGSTPHNVTEQFGTILAHIHNANERDATLAMLGPALRGTLVDFPYICKRQDLGADSLLELYRAANTNHRSATFSLEHWLSVAQNTQGYQPDMPLNLTNWLAVQDHVAGTPSAPLRLPLGACFAALHQQTWQDIDTSRSHFFHADIADMNAQRCDFSETIFGFATLSHCMFEQCNLSQADLRMAKLSHCIFDHVKLGGANLQGASFEDVTFRHCDLTHLSPAQHQVLADAVRSGNVHFEHCKLPESLANHTAVTHLSAVGDDVIARRGIQPTDETHARHAAPSSHGFEPYTVITGDRARDGYISDDPSLRR